MKIYTLLCLLALLTGARAVKAQTVPQDPPDPFVLFDQGEYDEALRGFMILQSKDRENKLYDYWVGRSLLKLGRDTDEAIEKLYRANTARVEKDASFYLGMAYFQNYNFREARKRFEEFASIAGRQEKKEYKVEDYIIKTRMAEDLTATYFQFDVSNVTFISLEDSTQYSQIVTRSGGLCKRPDGLSGGMEYQDDLSDLMFLQEHADRGSYAYFSGPAKDSKKGTDIYRVKKQSMTRWGKPEPVEALNTKGNEILPYFDPIGENVYFASDGLPGMGGYDLFSSHYDADRDEWTEPLSMGFPVNGVTDDVLVIPGADLGMVLFFSDRVGTDSTYTVYRVHFSEPRRNTTPGDFQQLHNIAVLGGVAEYFLAELEELEDLEELDEADSELLVSGDTGGEESRIASGEGVFTEIGQGQVESSMLLAEAQGHQYRADSLRDLAVLARGEIKLSDDLNDRWVWQKQIMLWEKRSRDESEKANLLFAKVEEEQVRELSASAVNPPESIEVDREVDGLIVYTYSDSDSKPVLAPVGEPGEVVVSGPDNAGAAYDPHMNRFEILAASPYTQQLPIPLDMPFPGGVFYSIQLGVFKVPVAPETFGGICPVNGESIPERGIVKYYAGKFADYGQAADALVKVREAGYADAFIVAWYNGTRISTMKAKELE